MDIKSVVAKQILDSRGNPTIEAEVMLVCGAKGRASVPSGASTGSHEAHELRDGEKAFGGKGVLKAIQNIFDKIAPAVISHPSDNQRLIDNIMIELDGTPNKSNLGANAILAVSLAVAHAAARARNKALYRHINDLCKNPAMNIPMPMMNILNGGKHAQGSTDIQESMIIPVGATTYAQAVQMGAEVFHALGTILYNKGYTTTVGDEGGYAPAVKSGNKEALDLIADAVAAAGYTLGKDIVLGLDVAASEFYSEGKYHLATEHKDLSADEMIEWYTGLAESYPLVSIEDALAEDDWDNWVTLTSNMSKIQLVGDDLLVTNSQRLQRAIDLKAANAILIKPNQIGTLTETLDTIALAKKNGWNTIISHRSGETEDTTIAHIAVGAGAGQIKTGSLSRSERVAKHNELMRIELGKPSLSLHNPF